MGLPQKQVCLRTWHKFQQATARAKDTLFCLIAAAAQQSQGMEHSPLSFLILPLRVELGEQGRVCMSPCNSHRQLSKAFISESFSEAQKSELDRRVASHLDFLAVSILGK